MLTEDHAHRFEALLTLTDCKAKADIVICGRRMHIKAALFLLHSSSPLGILMHFLLLLLMYFTDFDWGSEWRHCGHLHLLSLHLKLGVADDCRLPVLETWCLQKGILCIVPAG